MAFESTNMNMTALLPTLHAGPAAASCCAAAVGLDAELPAGRIAEIAKALAEPVRVRILDVLRRSDVPVCQCELVPLFDIPQPTLSHHIKKLTDAGLVTVERRHRWAYYSLAPDAFEELTRWLS
jgi:ArsR family transcriptional regulator, arsenate/arsenite/antimonite-responsive transcriptional repressor